MPIRKQASMVASRTKISMSASSVGLLERGGCGVLSDRMGRCPEKNPFDDEKQQANAADRDRQIGDAYRQEGKIPDRIMPGHFDKPLPPDDHEYRNQGHQKLNDEIECVTKSSRQLVCEVGYVHVQVKPVGRGRADEG